MAIVYGNIATLKKMSGKPAVVVLTHPALGAGEDELKPRGSGAIYGTTDGSITIWRKSNGIVKVHHMKWRGVPFQPLYFQMKPMKHASVVDSEEMTTPSVRAVMINDSQAKRSENDAILECLNKHGSPAVRTIARETGIGKSHVNHRLQEMARTGLVTRNRNGNKAKYAVSSEGKVRIGILTVPD